MSIVYSQGSADVDIAASGKISVMSDSPVKLYQKVGYPNYPDSWDLIATTTAGEQYVSDAFTAATTVRIEASAADVEYEIDTLSQVGAPNGSTVTAAEYQEGLVHKTVLTLAATPVTITDDAGVAQYGGCGKIYDLPDGLITFLGCIVDGDLTLGTTGTITATFAGGVALGTVTATTGATLTSTEADIMAETDVAAATASVATIAGASVAPAVVNGQGTAKDVYLNFVVDDDATHTSGTGSFTGTVTLVWSNIGDLAA